jgi:hypothetical protein
MPLEHLKTKMRLLTISASGSLISGRESLTTALTQPVGMDATSGELLSLQPSLL